MGAAETSDLAGKLSAWFEAHATTLELYARQWGGGADTVQEVFARLAALAARRGMPSNVKAWLYASTRNAAVAEYRAESRRRRREREAAVERPPWFEPTPEDRVDADAASAALSILPRSQREIVVLRLWSGLTLTEISQVVGLPLSTVNNRYRAALFAVHGVMSRKESPCRKVL